jgi:hypothetical protein
LRFLFSNARELLALLLETVLDAFRAAARVLVGDPDIEPVMRIDQAVQVLGLGDLRALGQLLRAAVGRLAESMRSIRSKASSSTMRIWSARSFLVARSSSSMI